ncbi:MAG: hypothetical protein ABFD08_10780 [Syntrophomonas sp.]
MDRKKAPLLRLLVAVVFFAMILYMPTREFLKVTFMLGIPFVFLLAYWKKKERYSVPWIVSLLLLLVVCGGYVYMLTQLPERIEIHRIVVNGGVLVAEGKYDQAINEYKKLEKLGKKEEMQEKISNAEKEKNASSQLYQARKLIVEGQTEQARKVLDSIPKGTRAYQDAKEVRKVLK